MIVPPIDDDETLIRHIHPDQWPPGNEKPNSGAFRDEELSVDRERLRSVEVCCALRPDHGFMRFSVADLIEFGLTIEPDPIPKPLPGPAQEMLFPDVLPPSLENNPAHSIIHHVQKGAARRLRDRAAVIFRPGEYAGPPPVVPPPAEGQVPPEA